MTPRCEDVQSWIPKELAGDLGPQEQQQLQAHLRDCAACATEKELYLDAWQQLRSVSNVPVPRHFFVYPEERHSWLTQWIHTSNRSWKVAFGAATLVFALLVGLLASRFQFRADGGVYSFSFGRPLPSQPASPKPDMDVAALKAELVRLLEARSERERVEWMNAARREFLQTNRNLNRQQQRQWDAALAALELRLGNRMEDQSLALKAGVDRSLGSLYQTLQLQRQQDLAMTRTRLDRITAQGALKERETEEILSTLLQVAELK